jgi:hypothetical protein
LAWFRVGDASFAVEAVLRDYGGAADIVPLRPEKFS